MKKILVILALFVCTKAVLSQEHFPILSKDALVKSDSLSLSNKGAYKLLVYGAIGCSYSRYLIDNLHAFDDCKQVGIIILLNDPKDSILKKYPELIKSYKVYSNKILKHQLAKNNDITPQTFLFKKDDQLLHIKGLKKKMFVKIDKQVNCK